MIIARTLTTANDEHIKKYPLKTLSEKHQTSLFLWMFLLTCRMQGTIIAFWLVMKDTNKQDKYLRQ